MVLLNSNVQTSSSVAASASISLSNVARVVIGSNTTISTARSLTDLPGSVNFGGAVVSASRGQRQPSH